MYEYDFVETGKATSYHDTTMWEYFQTDSYNWSYLVYMTKRAGLEDLFQGTNTQYGPNITFLGIGRQRAPPAISAVESVGNLPVSSVLT